MTTAPVITRVSAEKGLCSSLAAPVTKPAPTPPISRTFSALLDAVDAAIEMERDLSHAFSWDPANNGFAETAENQWQECLRLASGVFTATAALTDDHPLQRMGMLMHFLIESGSTDEALRFQNLLHEHRDLFTTADPGFGQALNRAARQVSAIVEMATAVQDFASV